MENTKKEDKIKPRYIHDCSNCTFLGTFEEYDLYVCSYNNKIIKTVVGRFSSDGPDYISGVGFAIDQRTGKYDSQTGFVLLKALELSEKLGFKLASLAQKGT
ncbi:MAG: hypothetical protein PHD05_00460 [Sphaerochaetaceae bacterium]|jgi:hypothetical protein|nr:hypothetical protein [Sphaerochaetaceae bacterium]